MVDVTVGTMTAYPQTWLLNKGLATVFKQCGESHDRIEIIDRREYIEASILPVDWTGSA